MWATSSTGTVRDNLHGTAHEIALNVVIYQNYCFKPLGSTVIMILWQWLTVCCRQPTLADGRVFASSAGGLDLITKLVLRYSLLIHLPGRMVIEWPWMIWGVVHRSHPVLLLRLANLVHDIL